MPKEKTAYHHSKNFGYKFEQTSENSFTLTKDL